MAAASLDVADPGSWPVVLTAEQVCEVLACPGASMKDRRRHLNDRYVHRGVLVPIGGVPETKRLSSELRYSRSDVWRLVGFEPVVSPDAGVLRSVS